MKKILTGVVGAALILTAGASNVSAHEQTYSQMEEFNFTASDLFELQEILNSIEISSNELSRMRINPELLAEDMEMIMDLASGLMSPFTDAVGQMVQGMMLTTDTEMLIGTQELILPIAFSHDLFTNVSVSVGYEDGLIMAMTSFDLHLPQFISYLIGDTGVEIEAFANPYNDVRLREARALDPWTNVHVANLRASFMFFTRNDGAIFVNTEGIFGTSNIVDPRLVRRIANNVLNGVRAGTNGTRNPDAFSNFRIIHINFNTGQDTDGALRAVNF